MNKPWSKATAVIGTPLAFGAGYEALEAIQDKHIEQALLFGNVAITLACLSTTAILQLTRPISSSSQETIVE